MRGEQPSHDATAAADQEALLRLERATMEARASQDHRYVASALTENFIGFTASGFVDKATWIGECLSPSGRLREFNPSSARVGALGNAARLLTYRIVRAPSGSAAADAWWAASVYVREEGQWRMAYHNEVPVTEHYTPAMAAASTAGIGRRAENATDPVTSQLLAGDRRIWTARAERRVAAFDELLADTFIFVNPVTEQPLGKQGSQATWASASCTLTGFDLREARGQIVAEGVGILTYMGIGHGACDGVPIEPRWITDVYLNENGTWRSAMLLETRVEVR